MLLYTYFRSSAAFRVRIALNLKGQAYESSAISLPKGAHRKDDFGAINPQKLVPAVIEDGHLLTQSLAIMEYLEEKQPLPPLLPKDLLGRARVRSLSLLIACEIHPLNNLRVLQHLKRGLPRRHAHDGRLLPRAADLQRQPLRMRPHALCGDHEGVRCMHEARRVRPGTTDEAAGRRIARRI